MYKSPEQDIKNIMNLTKINDNESIKKILDSFDKVINLNDFCFENKTDMSHDDFLKIIAKRENFIIFRCGFFAGLVNISKYIDLKYNMLFLFKMCFLENKKNIMHNVPNYVEEINCMLGEFYFDNLPISLRKIRILDYDNKTDYKYFYDDEKHNNKKINHKTINLKKTNYYEEYEQQCYIEESYFLSNFYQYQYDEYDFDESKCDYNYLVDVAIAKRELIEKYFIKIPFGCKVVDKNDVEILL